MSASPSRAATTSSYATGDRLCNKRNPQAVVGQVLVVRPGRYAIPSPSLCERRGLEIPDQRDVERRGHPLRVETPEGAQSSPAVQRREGYKSGSVLPSGYQGWTDGRSQPHLGGIKGRVMGHRRRGRGRGRRASPRDCALLLLSISRVRYVLVLFVFVCHVFPLGVCFSFVCVLWGREGDCPNLTAGMALRRGQNLGLRKGQQKNRQLP